MGIVSVRSRELLNLCRRNHRVMSSTTTSHLHLQDDTREGVITPGAGAGSQADFRLFLVGRDYGHNLFARL